VSPLRYSAIRSNSCQVRKLVDGSWQQDCPSSRELQELLRVTPKENDSWTFF